MRRILLPRPLARGQVGWPDAARRVANVCLVERVALDAGTDGPALPNLLERADNPGVSRARDSKTTQIYAHYAPSAHEVEMVNAAFAEAKPTAAERAEIDAGG